MKTIISLIILFLLTNPFTLFAQSEYDKLVEEGLQLLIEKNIPAAIVKYKAAYKIDSTKVEANYGLGVAYLHDCQEKNINCNNCLLFLNKAIKIDASYKECYYYKGQYKGTTKDYDGALTSFNNAIKQYPNDANYYFSRGMIKIKLNDGKGACEDMYKSSILGLEIAKELFDLNCGIK